MKTLAINIPNDLVIDENEAKIILASKLYERGSLTLGQAAELAGYTKPTFMEILGKYNVSIFNYTASDIANDVTNAQNYNR